MKVKHLIRLDLPLTVSLLLDRTLEFSGRNTYKTVLKKTPNIAIKIHTIKAIKIHRLLLSFTILRHGKVALMFDLRQSAPQSEPDWDYITV